MTAEHCHDTHVSGEVVQAVQTLTSDLRSQTRSLAEWEPAGTKILQTCKHISFALAGLLIPCGVTIALQATLLQLANATTCLKCNCNCTWNQQPCKCKADMFACLHYCPRWLPLCQTSCLRAQVTCQRLHGLYYFARHMGVMTVFCSHSRLLIVSITQSVVQTKSNNGGIRSTCGLSSTLSY